VAVTRNVGWSRPERRGSGLRAGAGAIASGLAAASIAVLVTVTIAAGGHSAPRPHLARPAVAVSRPSAKVVPLDVPRLARPAHAVARLKRRPAHHAPEPLSPPPVTGQTGNSVAGSSSWTPSSGVSYWQQLAENAGMPAWAINNMGSHDRYRWPRG
jgi:hypothetical protein